PLMKVVIDEAEAAIVREVFQRYVERGQSLREITLWLNEIEAGGSTAWGVSNVADLLDRWTYIGVEIHGRTRQRKDRDTGRIKQEIRPRSEWKARRMRSLQIVPRALWKAAQKLRTERAALFQKGSRSRAHAYPKRLLSLVCGSCGATLV